MDSDSACFSAGPLERQLLALLLTETRRRTGLTPNQAAQLWGQSHAHLQALEAGSEVPDWWEIRRLLAVYGRDLVAFVTEFEERLAALAAGPAEPEDFFSVPDALR